MAFLRPSSPAALPSSSRHNHHPRGSLPARLVALTRGGMGTPGVCPMSVLSPFCELPPGGRARNFVVHVRSSLNPYDNSLPRVPPPPPPSPSVWHTGSERGSRTRLSPHGDGRSRDLTSRLCVSKVCGFCRQTTCICKTVKASGVAAGGGGGGLVAAGGVAAPPA